MTVKVTFNGAEKLAKKLNLDESTVVCSSPLLPQFVATMRNSVANTCKTDVVIKPNYSSGQVKVFYKREERPNLNTAIFVVPKLMGWV